MAPRDEQDYSQRRQQIIDGALKVFASKGFEQATNKEIAEAAGIGSPGLIYHYFSDKADLFVHVLKQHMPVLKLLVQPEALCERPPREVLTLFGNEFLKIQHNPTGLAMFKLLLSEAARRPMVAEMIDRIGPGRAIPFLRRYLEHQMALGRLRRVDSAVAARVFIGSIIAYLLTRELLHHADVEAMSPDTMVETTVDIFLHGMQPEPAAHAHME